MHFVVSHSTKPHFDASGIWPTLRNLQFLPQDETLIQPNGDPLRPLRDLRDYVLVFNVSFRKLK